jgi:hypothetical protein
MDHHRPPQPLPVPPPAMARPLSPVLTPTPSVVPPRLQPIPEQDPPSPGPSLEREIDGAQEQTLQQEREQPTPSLKQREHGEQQLSSPNTQPLPKPTPSTRPTRVRKAPDRFGYDGQQGFGYQATDTSNERVSGPSIFKARAMKDPDTLSFEEAMRSPEKQEWTEAARGEVTGLEDKQTWTEVPMSEALTKGVPKETLPKRRHSKVQSPLLRPWRPRSRRRSRQLCSCCCLEYSPTLSRSLFVTGMDHRIHRLHQCLRPIHTRLPRLDPHSPWIRLHNGAWDLPEIEEESLWPQTKPTTFLRNSPWCPTPTRFCAVQI